MTEKADITIDLNKTCTRCGAKGVTESGLCLKCVGIVAMDSIPDIRRKVQELIKEEPEKFPPKAKEKDENKITSQFISQCLNENAKGDASLYAELFRDLFVFCKGMKEWFTWDSHYWKLDIMDKAITAVEEVAQKYLEEYKTTSAKVAEMSNAGAEGSDIKKLQAKCTKLSERIRQLRGTNRRDQCLKFVHTMSNLK